jgi:hypothetical protein
MLETKLDLYVDIMHAQERFVQVSHFQILAQLRRLVPVWFIVSIFLSRWLDRRKRTLDFIDLSLRISYTHTRRKQKKKKGGGEEIGELLLVVVAEFPSNGCKRDEREGIKRKGLPLELEWITLGERVQVHEPQI